MNILEIDLLSDNLCETRKFYHGSLGLSIIFENDSTISFLAGQSILSFKQSNQLNPYYHFAFTIPNNKLEEALEWISSKVKIIPIGANETIADFKNWNAKSFYFYDTNGNILEFIARFDLDNASTLPFQGSSILSISEIGIVIDDVISYCKELITKYQLSFFSKQPVLKNFAAIGDDHGLLILSTPGKQWFPTHLHATKYWTGIKLLNDRKRIDIFAHQQDQSLLLKQGSQS